MSKCIHQNNILKDMLSKGSASACICTGCIEWITNTDIQNGYCKNTKVKTDLYPFHGLKDRAYKAVYTFLHTNQNGQCAVCRDIPEPPYTFVRGREYLFCIDHSHSTGKIRGLLCVGCNMRVALYESGKRKAAGDALKIQRYLLTAWDDSYINAIVAAAVWESEE